jgi:hypothetical protein
LTDHLGEPYTVQKCHNTGHATSIIKKNVAVRAVIVGGTVPFIIIKGIQLYSMCRTARDT